MSDATAADPAAALAAALGESGLPCTVEARERLAVLRVAAGEAAGLADAARRARVVSLARSHGFTHAALELLD